MTRIPPDQAQLNNLNHKDHLRTNRISQQIILLQVIQTSTHHLVSSIEAFLHHQVHLDQVQDMVHRLQAILDHQVMLSVHQIDFQDHHQSAIKVKDLLNPNKLQERLIHHPNQHQSCR